MLKSINPFTLELIETFEPLNEREVDRKLESAAKAFKSWKKTSFEERSKLMRSVAQILNSRKHDFAKIISSEMGKVLKEAIGEVEKCANCCDYFAENAERFLADEHIPTEAQSSFVAFQPLGAVLAVMPWNFPFWQVFRFAAPTLMAGNVGLLKHASNVSKCSLAIESVFTEAGFPEGVFQSLLIESRDVEKIISSDVIKAVSLTGSEFAGSEVARVSGQNLKKTVLELGGSDPFIVLEDADLDLAAKVATQSRMQNAGQSCIAAKRFIVVQSVKDQFIERFQKNIEELKQGDPFAAETTTGPMARVDLAEDVEKQMKTSISKGARLVTGGQRFDCNFKPALLDQVNAGMPVFDEEVFGPVASVITAKNVEDAISIANDHRYGLGGSVWTKDIEKGTYVARQIESGCVFVNSLMRSDQRLPFGGIKKSGYGRELSQLGIREFVNAKTIFVS